MDPWSLPGICIILLVLGVVFWLPVFVFAPLIKALADRISGRSAQLPQLKALEKKVMILEHEVDELRSRTLSIEDSHKFSQSLIEGLKEKQERK